MVSCPVCDEIIDAEFINQHLDQNCDLGKNEIEMSRRQVKDDSAQAKAWARLLGTTSTNADSR
jgi:hypothetical protein